MTIDVIQLAKEAGIAPKPMILDGVEYEYQYVEFNDNIGGDEFGCIERFAALVAAAEREECSKVCDYKAAHCETKAQEAIENGEHDEVNVIRSTAWQIKVCGAAIRARKPA